MAIVRVRVDLENFQVVMQDNSLSLANDSGAVALGRAVLPSPPAVIERGPAARTYEEYRGTYTPHPIFDDRAVFGASWLGRTARRSKDRN